MIGDGVSFNAVHSRLIAWLQIKLYGRQGYASNYREITDSRLQLTVKKKSFQSIQ